jgi:hypothetical protein
MKKAYWVYVITFTIACAIGLAYLFKMKHAVEQAAVASMPTVEYVAPAVVESAEPAKAPEVAPEPPKVAEVPTPQPTPGPQFYAPFPSAEPKQAVDAKGKPYKGLRTSWQHAERIP